MTKPGNDSTKPLREGGHPPRSPRRRRSAEKARRDILTAAERRLLRGGPEGVRLEDVAADVGVSRPTVLYHFGSREGLFRALVRHAIANMQEDLIRVLGTRRPGDSASSRSERTFETLERISEVFARRGYARVMAGLILSRRDLRKSFAGTGARFAQVVHAFRSQRRIERGRSIPDLEDSLSGLTLIFVALFGDALVGPHTRLAFGLTGDAEGARKFRRWLAEMIEAYEPPELPPVAEGPSGPVVTPRQRRARRAGRSRRNRLPSGPRA